MNKILSYYIKRKESILFIIILILVLILYLTRYNYIKRNDNNIVEIYLNNKYFKTLNVEENKIFEIKNNDNINIIKFTKNGFKMIYSNCKNQECIKQGEVNKDNIYSRILGNSIICLPHGLVIKLNP